MKKILALIAFALLAAPVCAQPLKPLVIQGGVTKQLPANTTLQLNASGTGAAPVNIGQGTAPSSPVNGDCWITTAGMFCRANGTTSGPFTSSGVPASPSDATQFLNGAASPAFANVKDSDLSTSNITTNNVTTSKHGFAPILPNDATQFLNGIGGYSVPAGTSTGTVTTSGSPASGNLAKFSGGTAITNGDLSGDCTTSGTLAIACTKTGGVAFATSATTDTTNAANISSGVLGAARGGAGTANGILKANGSGTVSAAASGTDYAPATSGASILYGNGSGGFSNVTVGTGLNFAGGTLTGTGSTPAYVTAASVAGIMSNFGGL